MVMFFRTSGMMGRSTGIARAMGGNAVKTTCTVRRDLSAWEGKAPKKKPRKPKTGPVPRMEKQHPLGKTFVKRVKRG